MNPSAVVTFRRTALLSFLIAAALPSTDARGQGAMMAAEPNRPTNAAQEIGAPNKCLAGKEKCVSLYMAGLSKCAQLCAKKPDKKCYEVQEACLLAVKKRFTGGEDPSKGCFGKLEAKQDKMVAAAAQAGQTALTERQTERVCLTRDDAEKMVGVVEEFEKAVANALVPPFVPGGSVGVNGFSFFVGALGESCDTVCGSRGLLYDEAGTDGFAADSDRACQAVLAAAPGSPCAGNQLFTVFEDAPGCGCGFFHQQSPAGEPFYCVRDVAQAATSSCQVPGLSRMCACVNQEPDDSLCPSDCIERMTQVAWDSAGFPFQPTSVVQCSTTGVSAEVLHAAAIPPHFDVIAISETLCGTAVGAAPPVQIPLTPPQSRDCRRIAAQMIEGLTQKPCDAY